MRKKQIFSLTLEPFSKSSLTFEVGQRFSLTFEPDSQTWKLAFYLGTSVYEVPGM